MEMAEIDHESPRPPGEGGNDDAVDDQLQTRFGAVPRDPDRQVRFRGGLPGFPQVEWFQLDPIPGVASDLMVLQALDSQDLGFITMPLPDEVPVIRAADIAEVAGMLDIEPGELLVLAIVTLAPEADGVAKFINLRAPLFVDVRRKIGAQVVLGDAAYPLRHRVVAPPA